jgi:hypothetical protein
VRCQRLPGGDHGDGLGHRQATGGGLHLGPAVLGHPGTQLPEHGDNPVDLRHRLELGGELEAAAEGLDPAAHDRHLLLVVGGDGQHDHVEAPLQRRRQVVDAPVAVVGRGDHVEALGRLDLVVELGDGERLLRQDGDERVLHVGGDAGQLLDAGDAALGHRPHDRAGHHGGAARALGQQPGVVPPVADGLLAGPRGALHEQGRVAGDGGREVLGDHGLGRARDAEEQQRPVGRQRGDGHLDEPPVAEVLGRHLGAV